MTEKEKKHQYYLLHAEEIKERSRLWALNNPEKNKDNRLKASKNYEEKHREARREKSKKYYQENKEKAKEANRQYFLKHRDKYPHYSRKYHYSMTQEVFEKMLSDQGNKCAICFDTFTETLKPFVDHDHVVERVRQLLCKKCNSFIGLAKEDPTILLSAIQYINKHKVNNG